ncbi:hypothetical protein ACEPAI_7396 [Sanghuangporus weigelae]
MSTDASNSFTYAQVARVEYRRAATPAVPPGTRPVTIKNASREPMSSITNVQAPSMSQTCSVLDKAHASAAGSSSPASGSLTQTRSSTHNASFSSSNGNGKVLGRWGQPQGRSSNKKRSSANEANQLDQDKSVETNVSVMSAATLAAGKHAPSKRKHVSTKLAVSEDLAHTRPPTRQAVKNTPACWEGVKPKPRKTKRHTLDSDDDHSTKKRKLSAAIGRARDHTASQYRIVSRAADAQSVSKKKQRGADSGRKSGNMKATASKRRGHECVAINRHSHALSASKDEKTPEQSSEESDAQYTDEDDNSNGEDKEKDEEEDEDEDEDEDDDCSFPAEEVSTLNVCVFLK